MIILPKYYNYPKRVFVILSDNQNETTMSILTTETGNAKRNFSKYDVSGTDPNRYASVSNTQEADQYLHKGKKSIIPGLRVNISTPERIVMIGFGAYLLYRAFKKNDSKKIAEGVSGGTMLFRGISGYCPAYDTIGKLQTSKQLF